jgi:hypothetical protein
MTMNAKDVLFVVLLTLGVVFITIGIIGKQFEATPLETLNWCLTATTTPAEGGDV